MKFSLIADLQGALNFKEKGQTALKSGLSLSAERRGQLSNFFVEDLKVIEEF